MTEDEVVEDLNRIIAKHPPAIGRAILSRVRATLATEDALERGASVGEAVTETKEQESLRRTEASLRGERARLLDEQKRILAEEIECLTRIGRKAGDLASLAPGLQAAPLDRAKEAILGEAEESPLPINEVRDRSPSLERELERLDFAIRSSLLSGRPSEGVDIYLRVGAVVFDGGFREHADDSMGLGEAHVRVSAYRGVTRFRHACALIRISSINLDWLFLLQWCGRWFASGAPCVRIAAPEAAALMLTDIPAEFVDSELRSPWPAFMVRVPTGLVPFPTEGPERWVDRVLVRRGTGASGQRIWWIQIGSGNESVMLTRERLSDMVRDEELLDKEGVASAAETVAAGVSWRPSEAMARTFAMMARLIIGVCCKLGEGATGPSKPRPTGAPRRRPGAPPETTEVKLGFPVRVDFSGLVRDHLLGRVRRLHKVQWLVRGHWRNQACGERLSQRRMKWIEPFWKGPLDAPILVREHIIGEHRPGTTGDP